MNLTEAVKAMKCGEKVTSTLIKAHHKWVEFDNCCNVFRWDNGSQISETDMDGYLLWVLNASIKWDVYKEPLIFGVGNFYRTRNGYKIEINKMEDGKGNMLGIFFDGRYYIQAKWDINGKIGDKDYPLDIVDYWNEE